VTAAQSDASSGGDMLREMTEQNTGLPPGTELVRTVRRVQRFEAPPDRVFSAWSEPDELARWFPRRVDSAVGTPAEEERPQVPVPARVRDLC